MGKGVQVMAIAEGRSRLEAERALVRAYREDYERLSRRKGHVEAVRSLVKAHKRRYDTIVHEIRERERNASQAA